MHVSDLLFFSLLHDLARLGKGCKKTCKVAVLVDIASFIPPPFLHYFTFPLFTLASSLSSTFVYSLFINIPLFYKCIPLDSSFLPCPINFMLYASFSSFSSFFPILLIFLTFFHPMLSSSLPLSLLSLFLHSYTIRTVDDFFIEISIYSPLTIRYLHNLVYTTFLIYSIHYSSSHGLLCLFSFFPCALLPSHIIFTLNLSIALCSLFLTFSFYFSPFLQFTFSISFILISFSPSFLCFLQEIQKLVQISH